MREPTREKPNVNPLFQRKPRFGPELEPVSDRQNLARAMVYPLRSACMARRTGWTCGCRGLAGLARRSGEQPTQLFRRTQHGPIRGGGLNLAEREPTHVGYLFGTLEVSGLRDENEAHVEVLV